MEDLKKSDYIPQLMTSHFQFTPIQTILINTKMPIGFKLETEENVFKSMEIGKKSMEIGKKSMEIGKKSMEIGKKSMEIGKKSMEIGKKSMEIGKKSMEIGKKSMEIGKKVPKSKLQTQPEKIVPKNIQQSLNALKEQRHNTIHEHMIQIKRKCEGAFNTIKQEPNITLFYFDDDLNTLSLSSIEKNIHNMRYISTVEFLADLRRVCDQNMIKYNNNNFMKENINFLRKISEELFKENEPKAKMSLKEKNNLGNDIRNLSIEEQKGLINLLRNDVIGEQTKTSFEFDLDALSEKKLRELETYASDCLLSRGNNNRKAIDDISKSKTDISTQNKVLNNKTMVNNQDYQSQSQHNSASNVINDNMTMVNKGNCEQRENKNTALNNCNNQTNFHSDDKKTVLSDIDSLSNLDSDSKMDLLSS